MADTHRSENLDSVVNHMLSQGPHQTFETYWELYMASAFISEPKGIYFRVSQDSTIRNIAIVGDGKIVDIEADENSDASAISVSPYGAFSEVILHTGLIPTLPRTQKSMLNVLCRLAGSTSLSPYWCAYNEEEAERLRDFAKILIQVVSS